MMFRFVVGVLALVGFVAAIPVDNGVQGDPEIECGASAIIVNFNTQNPFEGKIYVKGLSDVPECRSEDRGRQVAGITLPFGACGTSRMRSLNPRGVFVSTEIVISFHPLFLTKVDRAYKIQCFYMEADKTVDTELEVSVLTTGQDFSQGVAIMPVCRYDILDGGPSGPIIDFAIVGQQVYHKWTCDTETVDTFCMVVHSCYVDDQAGDRVDLIGPDGCAVDVYLLNNPEYLTDLMAGVEAHVFKYADRSGLYFQCQITIIIKEPGLDCPRPNCATPPGRGGPRPAGPQPAPVANAFPLVAGSPYLPLGGSAAQRPAFNRVPAPAQRPGPRSGAFGQRRPGPGRRAPFARRPFDAPALKADLPADAKAAKRAKRDTDKIEFDDYAAGTMDVRFDLKTLDIDENTDAMPDALKDLQKHHYAIQTTSEQQFCVSLTFFVVFLSLVLALLFSVVVVLVFVRSRVSRKL